MHASDAARNAAYRDRRKADLLAQLDEVNGTLCETKLPYSYKDISSRPDGKFGGSVFADIYSKLALDQAGALAVGDFVAWLRDLHDRITPKDRAFLWSPAEFDPDMASDTSRGLANIKAIWGIWLDCDGGDLQPHEFAAMFPHLTMVMYNSASSTKEAPRWRAVIPTTCAMTIDVHRDILMQLMKALNRRGYYSKKQLEKRAQRGLGGKLHGFDPSKFAACSLFYLPVQAAAGRDASFFMTFDGGKRQAINPYEWIDKTIIDHRPRARARTRPDGAATDAGDRVSETQTDARVDRRGGGREGADQSGPAPVSSDREVATRITWRRQWRVLPAWRRS